MSSDFRVGDEVVCINKSYDSRIHPEYKRYVDQLELSRVYIVAEVRIGQQGHLVLGFNEFIWASTGSRFGFNAPRFRKVQKKFTGMAILHSLLITQPELVH